MEVLGIDFTTLIIEIGVSGVVVFLAVYGAFKVATSFSSSKEKQVDADVDAQNFTTNFAATSHERLNQVQKTLDRVVYENNKLKSAYVSLRADMKILKRDFERVKTERDNLKRQLHNANTTVNELTVKLAECEGKASAFDTSDIKEKVDKILKEDKNNG